MTGDLNQVAKMLGINVYVISAQADEKEWMWAWAGIDKSEECEGECWQYMGSEGHPDGDWTHCFRHRCHPKSGRREYRHYLASPSFHEKMKAL